MSLSLRRKRRAGRSFLFPPILVWGAGQLLGA